jgi:hypothetical protein
MDLWKNLLHLRRKLGPGIRVEIKLIKGKSTPIAKDVDRDAKRAARQPFRIDPGFRAGKIGKSKNNTGQAARMFPASGEDLVIRIYQTLSVRRRVQKIKFQTLSDDKKDFFDKHFAYAVPAIGNALHRHHIYEVRMNSEPQ